MAFPPFLLYGANGYTGQLILSLCSAYGLTPVLGGRKRETIQSLANKWNRDYRVFSLTDNKKLLSILKEFPVVLHAAGPFKYTAQPMIEACLKAGTHYLDITGEIDVFEMAKSYDDKAKKAGIMLMPGTGFDVVPTDCLSLFLYSSLPGADKLQLAFATLGGGLSHGTAATMIESLGNGGTVRQNGVLVKKPLGHKSKWIQIEGRRLFFMTIPWGDLSTAYFTTGIPHIETYTAIQPNVYRILKLQTLFNPLLQTTFIRNRLKNWNNKRSPGPTEEQRLKSRSVVWGEVTDKKREKVTALLTGPDGYTLTAHSSLLITKKVLDNNFKTGYQTPGAVYGPDLILEVPGTSRELVLSTDMFMLPEHGKE